MTLFGIDIHPRFQAGFPIEALPGAGFDFLSVKASEGTSSSFMEAGSLDWIQRGKRVGLLCALYHYLRPGAETQQADVFCAALKRAEVPGVLDAEALNSTGRATLTMSGIRAFLARCHQLGARVPLLYLPRWYWERMGSPDLAGLPTLWASSYPSKLVGGATDLYPSVAGSRWNTYGNLPVAVLQFSETGMVAARSPIDLNAFRGTREQLAALLAGAVKSGTTRRRETPVSYRIDPTRLPEGAGPDAAPTAGWDAVEHTISTPGPSGGWSGEIFEHLTFGWLGGFIQEAWSAPSGKHYVDRYNPDTKTGGRYVGSFVTQSWKIPPGDRALIVRCATRSYGSVTTEVER